MPRATVATSNPDTVEIEYDTIGSPEDPALLLVMGFTAQLIAWDDDLCRQLADRGRYVIRYDNRDCGLSTHLDGQRVEPMGVMRAVLAGEPTPPVPYNLSDMARDGVGLLDHLGIERAHVMGASMGGMIAQTIAIEHPDRCLSLVSVMSSPGDPRVGAPTKEALEVLLERATDRSGGVRRRRRAQRHLGLQALRRPRMAAGAGGRCLRPRLLPRGRDAPARRDLRQR